MVVYWSFLLLSIMMIFVCNINYRTVDAYGKVEKRAHLPVAILFFSIIILFIGLRSGIADTPTYIFIYNHLPNSIFNVNIEEFTRDKGFYILSIIFKQFISKDFHLWLLFIAVISGFSVMKTLYKYSSNFGLSVFLFIATCQFTWMLNGMRQFIAVACLFGVFNWIVEKKTWRFMIVVLFFTTIHGSAIMMIPAYFIVRQKPWSKNILIPIVFAFLIGVGMATFPGLFSRLLENTQYSGYMDNISISSGSKVYRALIAAIPSIIAIIARRKIAKSNHKIINILINLSLLNLVSLIIATFTSGIFVGRIGIYFELYNLLLLPWLISNCFTKKSKIIIYGALLILYVYYFIYQMVEVWNIYYLSDVLGIYI
jgi:transmembrane protein EpsG